MVVSMVKMVEEVAWGEGYGNLLLKVLLTMMFVIMVWELFKAKVCRKRPERTEVVPDVKPPAIPPDQEDEENAEECAGENLSDNPMTIWISPSGDKFHWNRECRGLAAVSSGSKKKRSECLHCHKMRLAKEKAD